MGICTDIMHDFALQEIKRIYSSYDGWKIIPRKQGNSYDAIVIIERLNRGTREIVKLLVTFKKEVTLDLIEEITRPEKITDGSVPRRFYAVMVPGNADTSSLPKDLPIYFMKSFTFNGKELIWVKKPARKSEEDS